MRVGKAQVFFSRKPIQGLCDSCAAKISCVKSWAWKPGHNLLNKTVTVVKLRCALALRWEVSGLCCAAPAGFVQRLPRLRARPGPGRRSGQSQEPRDRPTAEAAPNRVDPTMLFVAGGKKATHLGAGGPPRSAAETFGGRPGGDGGCTSRSEAPSALRQQMSLVPKLIIDSGISWSGVGH